MNKIDLEPERQIAILMRASELVLENPNTGLCWNIIYAIKEKMPQLYLQEQAKANLAKDCISLFTRENAIKYAGARANKPMEYYVYWWPSHDTNSRLNFLSWMIGELQKEVKHG